MKQTTQLTPSIEDGYDAHEIFIDVCKVAVALVIISMVLFSIV